MKKFRLEKNWVFINYNKLTLLFLRFKVFFFGISRIVHHKLAVVWSRFNYLRGSFWTKRRCFCSCKITVFYCIFIVYIWREILGLMIYLWGGPLDKSQAFYIYMPFPHGLNASHKVLHCENLHVGCDQAYYAAG